MASLSRTSAVRSAARCAAVRCYPAPAAVNRLSLSYLSATAPASFARAPSRNSECLLPALFSPTRSPRRSLHSGRQRQSAESAAAQFDKMPVFQHFVAPAKWPSPLTFKFYRLLKKSATDRFFMPIKKKMLKDAVLQAGEKWNDLEKDMLSAYIAMNTAYAQNDVKALQSSCVPDMCNELAYRAAARSSNFKYEFEMNEVLDDTKVLSLMVMDASTTAEKTTYCQLLARIRSKQSLRITDAKGKVVGGQQNKMIDEYVVFSRVVGPPISGRPHPKGWAVFVKLKPAEIEKFSAVI